MNADPQTPATRIRAYLDALPGTVNLGAEFAYGSQFRSEEWPHDSYPLTRDDVEALLAELARARAEVHQYRTALQGVARAAAVPVAVPPTVERRDRYAQAICEATGERWPAQAFWTEANAVLAVADAEQAAIRRERDLAIAHDRQPYPTAWAYEQACAALHRKEAAIARVLEFAASLDETGRQLAGPEAVHPVAAHIRHLLDTQPVDSPSRVADEEQQPETQAVTLPFTHADDDSDQLIIGVTMASTLDGQASIVYVCAQQFSDDGTEQTTVYVRPERVEQVVTALRAARSKAEEQPAVVAEPGKECAASISGNCLAEAQSETGCATEDGECIYAGQPGKEPTS
ncbi:hypothetical protein [Streptomyces sp. NPDC050704]|uniref:hypothetical protein n=1 Tax=Streptomyces sp. NPDC050704 TaxID=3157219 RepID=UPI0034284D81